MKLKLQRDGNSWVLPDALNGYVAYVLNAAKKTHLTKGDHFDPPLCGIGSNARIVNLRGEWWGEIGEIELCNECAAMAGLR